jgi:DUF4097 and DUF4098 domain-containing protein YvlB
MTMKFSTLPVLASLLFSLSLAADVKETEEFTFNLSPGGRISLDNINGDIAISGGIHGQVHVIARKKAGTQEYMDGLEIVIKTDDDHISIETRHPKSSGFKWGRGNDSSGSVSYELTVPANVNLDAIETVNGDVNIRGVEGTVNAETVNGDVEVAGLVADAGLETVNGSIEASFDRLGDGQRVSADTVNGKIVIRLPGDASARVNAETVNGGIDADDFGLEPEKGFVGRDLNGDIGSGGAKLSLDTVNGSIRVVSN